MWWYIDLRAMALKIYTSAKIFEIGRRPEAAKLQIKLLRGAPRKLDSKDRHHSCFITERNEVNEKCIYY